MSDLYETTVGSKTIYEGRVIDLVIEDVQLPNGSKSRRELVKHPGAVAIIPVTSDGKIVLIKQFRKALDRIIVEIPAGKLEKHEEPFACAQRELEEETGYKAKTLTYITSFYTSPGFADELIYLYFSDELERGTSKLDEDEFLEVIEVTLEEAEKLVASQQIYDAKTAYAIQYLKLKNMENLQKSGD